MNMEMVSTRKASGRRVLRFASLDDLLADVDRLAAADRDGSVRRLGNWTVGQSLGHIAAWMDYGFDGYPMAVPWFIRILGRIIKKRAVLAPMRAGFRLPKTVDGTHATEIISVDEGLRRLAAAAQRLKAQSPTMPNPVFGSLSHQQWIDLNLRHAELHLSFFAFQ